MPIHHALISTMLNVNTKLKDKRNKHLGNEYDRMSMWVFLSIMRARNKDLFTWWAIISAAAQYGSKSGSSRLSNESTYFGHSTSYITMIRNTIPFRDGKEDQVYTDACRRIIREGHDDYIVMAMDNNQSGQGQK